MLGGYGEVQMYLPISIGCVEGTLYEMLFGGCARGVLVAMEEEKPLRLSTVIQPLRQEKILDDGLVFA